MWPSRTIQLRSISGTIESTLDAKHSFLLTIVNLMSCSKPFLIVVTGRPAAGKSTLANWLSKELKLPVVSKDNIREVLFDRLGWKDRDWARQLGRVSIDLMFYFAQTQLANGHSIIMDNAFHPDPTTPRLLELKKQINAEIIQIICDANSEILFQRFMERAKNGNRHPGHGRPSDTRQTTRHGVERALCRWTCRVPDR
ncbi:MAG: AAA family ATPase [Aquificales bacterium]|nr:AAA family ATPase [Aquificales bacterium]